MYNVQKEEFCMYQINKINEAITCILDRYQEALYLIEGDEKALLIDCGMDQESLNDVVSTLTDKEIIVALTHGHIDHIGQSGDFKDVYMNPLDRELYQSHMHMSMEHFQSDGLNFKAIQEIQDMPEFFDLGNHIIDVIPLKGHTAGSVIFVSRLYHSVFTGDAIGSGCGCWMQLDESSHISEYQRSLNETIKILRSFGVDDQWHFYGGHAHQEYQSLVSSYNRLDFSLMQDMATLCQKLLDHQVPLKDTKATKMTYQPYYASYQKAEIIIVKEHID